MRGKGKERKKHYTVFKENEQRSQCNKQSRKGKMHKRIYNQCPKKENRKEIKSITKSSVRKESSFSCRNLADPLFHQKHMTERGLLNQRKQA